MGTSAASSAAREMAAFGLSKTLSPGTHTVQLVSADTGNPAYSNDQTPQVAVLTVSR